MDLIEFLLIGTFDLVLRAAGRFAIRLFSLGRWRVETLAGDEGRTHGAAGALSFIRDGRRVITNTGQVLAGAAFFVVLAAAGIALAVAL